MWNGWPVEELMSILILEQFAAVIGWLHLFGFEQISLQPFHIFPQLRKGSLTLKSDAFVWWFFSWLDIWMIFESAVHPLASPNCEEGFRTTLPSICFRKHESQWSKSDNLHRQRIIPRQPLTFEVEIIDASQGLDTAAGTAAQWVSPKAMVLISDAHLTSSWYAQRNGFCVWHLCLTNWYARKTSYYHYHRLIVL